MTMTLGAEFLIGGDKVVVDEVDADGSVAAAGGQVNDVWENVDGVPAIVAFDEWQSGLRPRRAGVPLIVGASRAGRPITLRPMWRGASGTSAPYSELPLAEAMVAATAKEAATCPDAQAIPTARGAMPATMHTMTDRFQNDRGQSARHPDHEAALRRDREERDRRGRDIYRADDPNYDPFRTDF